MTEEHMSLWGVLFEEDDGRVYLVAVEQSKDEADELLSKGKPVLARAP
jgi:hypothetical protein